MADPTATARVLGWIRAGYPDGVPQADYPALLHQLRRRLTEDEVRAIAPDLGRLSHGNTVPGNQINSLLAARSYQSVGGDDLLRVSARLALGGWPLAEADDSDEEPSEGTFLSRVIGWLRAGYPEGVPTHDYLPLLALLQRRLTRSEVKQVAKALRRSKVSPATPADVSAAIEDYIHQKPADADLERVRRRLEKKEWPLDWNNA